MIIDDSDIPTIRRALREACNFRRNLAKSEHGRMRGVYIKQADRIAKILTKVKPKRQP